jgi:hypothetical protein
MRRLHRRTVALLVVGLVSTGWLGAGYGAQTQLVPMNRMDHGPFVSSTITVDPFSPEGHHRSEGHRGVLFRLSPDGRQLDTIATGLRNPNGLSIGPKGEIYVSDNEGNTRATGPSCEDG